MALAVAGYLLNQGERRKAERARHEAATALAEAERARSELAESEATTKQVESQAAPEFAAKAARALQARQWEEAREAAATAVKLDPTLGAAWFEKGRTALQSEDFAHAVECFAKVVDDAKADGAMRARAGRLRSVAVQYARQKQARGELSSHQHTRLGGDLRLNGEMALAAWFLKLGGRDPEALKAQLLAAVDKIKQDNPGLGAIREPSIQKDEIVWVLASHPKLVDISALEGVPLTSLDLSATAVADIAPLKGMPLAELKIGETSVTDISPLQGMPLRVLYLPAGAPIRSLAPLAGAPLEHLNARSVQIDDLSPLAGMPLRSLTVSCTARDIAVLRDMPLEVLNIGGATNVEDFGALATLKSLKRLVMFTTRIADLGVLEGLPIERLELIACHSALDISPLAKLPLKYLDLSQAAERRNIEALAGMDLERLHIDRTRVADLTPLKGMKLKHLLACSYEPIADYSALKGMPLEGLMVGWMPLRWQARVCVVPDTLGFLKDIKTLKSLRFGMGPGDLKAYDQVLALGAALRTVNPDYEAGAFSRLEDGQITEVWLHDCKITDLSPLKGRRLTRVGAIKCPVTDLTPLAGMPLQGIHHVDRDGCGIDLLRSGPVGIEHNPLEVRADVGVRVRVEGPPGIGCPGGTHRDGPPGDGATEDDIVRLVRVGREQAAGRVRGDVVHLPGGAHLARVLAGADAEDGTLAILVILLDVQCGDDRAGRPEPGFVSGQAGRKGRPQREGCPLAAWDIQQEERSALVPHESLAHAGRREAAAAVMLDEELLTPRRLELVVRIADVGILADRLAPPGAQIRQPDAKTLRGEGTWSREGDVAFAPGDVEP